MATQTAERVKQVAASREANFARYERWRLQHAEQHPVVLTLDSLRFDLQTMGHIGPETWAQFEADEQTFLAENINARHTTPARYRFNGEDIIVAESQDNRPELTLRSVTKGGLEKSRAEAEQDGRYYFQYRRDELFMQFHDEMIAMMRGEVAEDTLIKFSVFPVECEIDDRRAILKGKAYNTKTKMGFAYIARRLPDSELELLTIRLDDCTPEVASECLRDYGFNDKPLSLEKSEELGKYLVRLKTTQFPKEDVEAAAVAQFDAARCKVKNLQTSSYGRDESSYDAYQFISDHQDHWAAYKAFNEQLARALNGEAISAHLLQFLARSISEYERAGSSVLSQTETDAVKRTLAAGRLDFTLAAAYKKILFHTNVGLFKDLYEAYKKTGKAARLSGDAHSMLGDYAHSASASGGAMAARGESASGCSLDIAVEMTAAQLAAAQGISLEEANRRLQAAGERRYVSPPKHGNDKYYLIQKWGVEQVKPRMENCISCDEKRWVAECVVCAECDYNDTENPGYITRLIERRKKSQRWQGLFALFTVESREERKKASSH